MSNSGPRVRTSRKNSHVLLTDESINGRATAPTQLKFARKSTTNRLITKRSVPVNGKKTSTTRNITEVHDLIWRAKRSLKILKIADAKTVKDTIQLIKLLHEAKVFQKLSSQRVDTQLAACIYVVTARHAYPIGIKDVSLVVPASTKNFSECLACIRQHCPNLEHHNTIWSYLPTVFKRLKFNQQQKLVIFDLTKKIIRVYRHRNVSYDLEAAQFIIVAAAFHAWKCVDPYSIETPTNKERGTITFKEFCDIFSLYTSDQKDSNCAKITEALFTLAQETCTNRSSYYVNKIFEDLVSALDDYVERIPKESEPDLEEIHATNLRDDVSEEDELYIDDSINSDASNSELIDSTAINSLNCNNKSANPPSQSKNSASTLISTDRFAQQPPRSKRTNRGCLVILPLRDQPTIETDHMNYCARTTQTAPDTGKATQSSEPRNSDSPSPPLFQTDDAGSSLWTKWVTTRLVRESIKSYERENPDDNFDCKLLSEMPEDAQDNFPEPQKIIKDYKLDISGSNDLTLYCRKTVIVRQRSTPRVRVSQDGQVDVDCDPSDTTDIEEEVE